MSDEIHSSEVTKILSSRPNLLIRYGITIVAIVYLCAFLALKDRILSATYSVPVEIVEVKTNELNLKVLTGKSFYKHSFPKEGGHFISEDSHFKLDDLSQIRTYDSANASFVAVYFNGNSDSLRKIRFGTLWYVK